MSTKRPRNVIIRKAHQRGMPVHDYVQWLVEQHGTPAAAARAIEVDSSSIYRWLHGAKPRSRLSQLADRRGMDVLPFIYDQLDRYGTLPEVGRALGVDTDILQKHLEREGGGRIRLRPQLPDSKRRKITQLLRDGFRPSHVARLTGLSLPTVYHYYEKIKLMKSKMRKAA